MNQVKIKFNNEIIATAQFCNINQNINRTLGKVFFINFQFIALDTKAFQNNTQYTPVEVEYLDTTGYFWLLHNVWFEGEIRYQINILQNISAEFETISNWLNIEE